MRKLKLVGLAAVLSVIGVGGFYISLDNPRVASITVPLTGWGVLLLMGVGISKQIGPINGVKVFKGVAYTALSILVLGVLTAITILAWPFLPFVILGGFVGGCVGWCIVSLILNAAD